MKDIEKEQEHTEKNIRSIENQYLMKIKELENKLDERQIGKEMAEKILKDRIRKAEMSL
jgi:hypothetical protein